MSPDERRKAKARELWLRTFEEGLERDSFAREADAWRDEWEPIAEALAEESSLAQSSQDAEVAERRDAWLTAHDIGRHWYDHSVRGGQHVVNLYDNDGEDTEGWAGRGPTYSAALLDAISKADAGGRTT